MKFYLLTYQGELIGPRLFKFFVKRTILGYSELYILRAKFIFKALKKIFFGISNISVCMADDLFDKAKSVWVHPFFRLWKKEIVTRVSIQVKWWMREQSGAQKVWRYSCFGGDIEIHLVTFLQL